ncbi:hypothetical protein J416_11542 [Gracilibacillus halophilus YIM-C55.5]|uniref:Uncharacterized protein n=1 Tax=Gracilibacillus halophilus YIM-C55.5 TaxID=1308866 RepID=N4W7Q6_9BACI|nr:EsaB/YukD family protein [Gracilibacillus halophilus]ENH96303.1 hypothetical protein J416_11542 [Gracilibacillus halophilus YIM-C55.5]
MRNTHIDITIDFREREIGHVYDLRIPVQISVKQLLLDVMDALKLGQLIDSHCAIKIKTKGIVLADDDMLLDYPVTSGDILTVL